MEEWVVAGLVGAIAGYSIRVWQEKVPDAVKQPGGRAARSPGSTLGRRRPRQDADESPSVQSKRGQSSQDPSSARRVVQRSRARFQAGGQDQQRSASEPPILKSHGGHGSRPGGVTRRHLIPIG